jgi:hypothetical protein
MASRKDPSRYVWLAISLRSEIERLIANANTASDLELEHLSLKLTDASIQIGQCYEKLIQLASPAPQLQQGEQLPF